MNRGGNRLISNWYAVVTPAAGLPTAPAPAGEPAISGGVGALVQALVGGVGYWGWSNKVTGDEAVRKLARDQEARQAGSNETDRKLVDEEQRRMVAEKAADVAEVAAEECRLGARRPSQTLNRTAPWLAVIWRQMVLA